MSMKRVMIQLPEDLVEWVGTRAKKNNLSFAAAVRQLLTTEQLKDATAPLATEPDRWRYPQTSKGASSSGRTAESKSANGGSIPPAPATNHPTKCHCGRGVILQAGPRKGKCTNCGNPRPVE